MRSNNGRKLIVHYVKNKTFASWAFSVYGPKLWNNTPPDIRNELNMETFKSKLKTHLFELAFNLKSDFVYY